MHWGTWTKKTSSTTGPQEVPRLRRATSSAGIACQQKWYNNGPRIATTILMMITRTSWYISCCICLCATSRHWTWIHERRVEWAPTCSPHPKFSTSCWLEGRDHHHQHNPHQHHHHYPQLTFLLVFVIMDGLLWDIRQGDHKFVVVSCELSLWAPQKLPKLLRTLLNEYRTLVP